MGQVMGIKDVSIDFTKLGVDFGSGIDKSVIAEIKFNPDGSIEILSISEDVKQEQGKDESPFAYPSDDYK
ncbi:hypothetical protein [Chryseobacterium vrystaatense]|uniref:Uncharacterized protein n=1 Tax=Chryseobacterium vrystaatense TaxID=307480 RepID=A0A1M4ZK93_9FLAO|nr:hypothetical protein [Chryseobacterium vrystaatense]SHF17986.1 hypothetical protein SAMN02787073_1612 [Chryseobacterium vrystaatense]